MNVGCAQPYPYTPPPATGYDPFYGSYGAYPGYAGGVPLQMSLQGLGGYSIVGQGPGAPPAAPPAAPGTQGDKSMGDKAKDFLKAETLGIQNGYLLGGAAALGLIWYGYSAGWFDANGRRTARGQ